jgi:hypothetical protein
MKYQVLLIRDNAKCEKQGLYLYAIRSYGHIGLGTTEAEAWENAFKNLTGKGKV